MVSLQNKVLVAQNCIEYESKSYIKIINMSSICEGCSDCVNYINGKCSKELFEEIEQIIKMN